MNTKNLFISVGLLALVAFLASFLGAKLALPSASLGGVNVEGESFVEGFDAGSTKQFQVSRRGALTQSATSSFTGQVQVRQLRFGGGIVNASGTDATNTTTSLSAANICGNSIGQWNPSHQSASATFPSAANLMNLSGSDGCLFREGEFKVFKIRNTNVTSSAIIPIAGASSTLLYASSSDAGLQLLNNGLYIPASSTAVFEFYVATTTPSTNSTSSNLIEILMSVFPHR